MARHNKANKFQSLFEIRSFTFGYKNIPPTIHVKRITAAVNICGRYLIIFPLCQLIVGQPPAHAREPVIFPNGILVL
jgi:hypothetical protein